MSGPLGALAGIKVLDLSRVLAGPHCTQMLADHGADVLKVEPPSGDETRTWGPPFDADGTASYFHGLNRNKRGIVRDLSQPTVREELMGLLESMDVLVENFKVGTLERWGMGWEVLRERFPRLIYCKVTGFGADGPYGALPGYDAAVQALSGIMSVNGEPDARGGGPLRAGVPVVDMATGLNAALGICLALVERGRSGRGQKVEVALYDTSLTLLHPHSANHLMDGRVPGRSGNAHPNIAPYDTFRTATEPLFLAVGNDRQFRLLCEGLGAPDLAEDPRFASNALRSQHRDALKERLEAALSRFDGRAIGLALVQAGVPCAPIHDIPTALADPHTLHRDMVVSIGEGYRGVASPIKLDRTPATYRLAPPRRPSDA